MGIDQAFNISVSGINTQREKLEIIASNLANIDTTRSITGGPYRRKMAIFKERPLSFAQTLAYEQQKLGGVEIAEIAEDETPFQKIYKPGHPDADSSGFVSLPNVSMSQEMVDLIYTQKLYEANITVFNASKKMAQDTLTIP